MPSNAVSDAMPRVTGRDERPLINLGCASQRCQPGLAICDDNVLSEKEGPS
jgi:hypothetical protein